MRRILLFAAVIFISGCEDRIAGTGCHSDQDCADEGIADAVCVDGLCVARCSAESPCPAGKVCDQGRCVANSGGDPCSRHEDCANCMACRDGRCAPQTADEDLKDECAREGCLTGTCNGAGSCGVAQAGAVCRPAAGGCDVAETCSGQSAECPADAVEPDTKVCRPVRGECDVAESCTGQGAECPADGFLAATTVCRSARGDCDAEETCSGAAPDCPADLLKPANTVCRPAAGECDVEEKCTGQDVACGADGKQSAGYECGAPTCAEGVSSSRRTCDGEGVCVQATQESCAPYVCGATSCKKNCDSNADCSTGICDLTKRTCATAVTEIDCAATAGALQAAISQCVAGTTCYLRVRGTCDKVVVRDRLVYLDGGGSAAIVPTTAGSAVSVVEDDTTLDETTSLALVGIAVRGAFGANAHGIQCTGVGNGTPGLSLRNAIIGGPNSGENNAGAGVSATNASVNVSTTTVQNNAGAGFSATNATVNVSTTTVQNNAGAGISAMNATVSVTTTTVQNNAGMGLSIVNTDCAMCLATIDRAILSVNVAGGVKLSDTQFTLTNSIVAANGLTPASSAIGGLRIISPGATQVFAHNTVTANGLSGKIGVECVLGAVALHNSIVWGNGGAGASDEVVGCESASPGSHIEGGASQACGSGVAPMLTTDFHLAPNSPCIDKAPDCANLTSDVDGDARPQGASNRCDVGADEVR